jgi:uncharacterized membrane protein
MTLAAIAAPTPSTSLGRHGKALRAVVVGAVMMLITAPTVVLVADLPDSVLPLAIIIVAAVVATAGWFIFTAADHQRAVTYGLISAGIMLLAFSIPMAAGASATAEDAIHMVRNGPLLTLALFALSIGASCLALGLVMARRDARSAPAT